MEICNDIEAKEARGFVLDWCKSENVIAVSVMLVLFAAVLSVPLWALMLKCVGKRNTWLAWSFTMACTNVLYFFVDGSGGKEAYMLCFIVSFLNGLPFGAKFLSDAILADVIGRLYTCIHVYTTIYTPHIHHIYTIYTPNTL